MAETIGIIGFGNMGSAIAERIKEGPYSVTVFDKDNMKTSGLFHINAVDNLKNLISGSRVIILAVKPQDFGVVLLEMKKYFSADKLIITIAAGKSTADIEKALGSVRVIRVMPNIALKIGQAESALSKGKYAQDTDLGFARELFNRLGKTWVIAEEMINAATAIIGSGPAYIYYDMENNNISPENVTEELKEEYTGQLKKAAESLGFDSGIALEFALSTTVSSINLAKMTKISVDRLRAQVTSKRGTTEAAVGVLAKDGSWSDAAKAAVIRAEELARGE